ncbi:MAG TPA: hypothetical protein VK465_07040 [Fibrobacteria bacterium]|nr:hypothetical protein [Fibrobacteria bacterium]
MARYERYHQRIAREDRADMAALRNAPRDEARIARASQEFQRYLEQKKAGKLPAWQWTGRQK